MKNFNLRNFLVEGKKAKDENIEEAGPGFMHDCAAHVVHETYGYGICLDGEHTLVENADGTHSVTHYDVFFKEGNKTVKNIPVGDLEVLTESNHGHKKKKNEADVAAEGETIEEEPNEDVASILGPGMAAFGIILTSAVAKLGMDAVLQYLAKKFPDKFAKASAKSDTMTQKGIDTVQKGLSKVGISETEDELREARLKKEVEDIIGK